MTEILVAFATFAMLVAASVGSLRFYERLPPADRQGDTLVVVRAAAGLFVVLTSLVLGLMLNSAKATFASADQNVHAFAINLILLDRTLRSYGADADEPRRHLLDYAQQLWEERTDATKAAQAGHISDRFLRDLASDLKRLQPGNPERAAFWQEAQQSLRKIAELRWTLIEQADGTIPVALICILLAWLMLIFASFDYCAPRNRIVVTTFVASAALIAGTIYLILDMDGPFDELIHVSPAPMERALAELRG